MISIGGESILMAARRMININTRLLFSSLERLSTGQRINRGSDDPAGLIASENLRAVLAGLEAEARALGRSDHVAAVAEGGLVGTSDMLIEANGLAITAANTAGLSEGEKQAIQGQLDSMLAAIDSTASNTSFNGDPLLDGTATITTANASLSLPDAATSSLGETVVDGVTYTLADLKSGGSLNFVDGDIGIAQQVIQNSLTEVSTARAAIGSFQKYSIGSRLSTVETSIESLSAANSLIRDTNFAFETALLNRSMVLQQSSMLAFGMILGNQTSILQLLG
ncbi:MAG: flagellin [Phycisphaerales bacterium]